MCHGLQENKERELHASCAGVSACVSGSAVSDFDFCHACNRLCLLHGAARSQVRKPKSVYMRGLPVSEL
jgi:hypothetical protein